MSGITVSFTPDARSVRLTRVGAPTPKQEGAPGVTIAKDKDEWIDVDGTGHGHSRWSYTERSDDSVGVIRDYKDEPVIVSQVIGAQITGNWWSNDCTFTWSDSNSRDQETSHIVDVPDGGSTNNKVGMDEVAESIIPVEPGWYNVPSSGGQNPITITYTLKDNADGATATAKYELKLHDEWENPAAEPETSRTGTWVVGGWSTNTGTTDVPLQWNFTSKSTVSLNVHFGANFNAKDWLNIGGKVEANQEISAEVPTTGNTTLQPNTKARPYVRYTIRTEWKSLDHYTIGGWDRNTARADGKYLYGADLPLRIPADLEALWQGPMPITNQSPPDPT
jgi:hypothetical protein